MCQGLSVIYKITTRRSTIDVRKKSDLYQKNRTTGSPWHVRKIWDWPQPVHSMATGNTVRQNESFKGELTCHCLVRFKSDPLASFSFRAQRGSDSKIAWNHRVGGSATKMLRSEIIELLNASNKSNHVLCIDRKLRSFWVEWHSCHICLCSRTYILNNLIHQLHNVFLLRCASGCTDLWSNHWSGIKLIHAR